VSTGYPVSTGHHVSIGHPVSTLEGQHKVTQRKRSESEYIQENHGNELPHIESIFVQSGLNHERELKQVKKPSHHEHHHKGNTRDMHNPQLYDVIATNPQQNFRKSSNKRSAQVDQVLNDQGIKKIPDKDVPHVVSRYSQEIPLEPVNKRRKTPSPAIIKASSQPIESSHVDTAPSRSVCNLAYSQSDTVYSSRHTTQSHVSGHTKPFNTQTSFKDGIQVNEKRNLYSEPMACKQIESSKHRHT
jgi:hypothetical protein